MSTQPPQPPSGLNLRGAVDLSSLSRRANPAGPRGAAGAPPAPAGQPGQPASAPTVNSLVVNVTSETFETVLQLSATVPIVLDLWADWCEPCRQLSPVLDKLVRDDGGTWLLAKIDVEAEKEIASMLRVQSLPTVLAVVGGRPVPLFQGALPEAQVRQVIDELLTVAAQNGVNGRLNVDGAAAPAEPAEPELPPLHQQAYDALEADDLDGAAAAYNAALRENPADAMAKAGLAQVSLLQRVKDADLAAARAAAAADPADLDAALLVADLDLVGGHVEDAFVRLIDLVRETFGDEREKVRVRLVELFEVVGAQDERVVQARRSLASALF